MDEQMFIMVSDWMKAGNLGIASPKKAMSKSDKRALEILDNTTQIIDGHYQFGLLRMKIQNFLTTDGSLRSNFSN